MKRTTLKSYQSFKLRNGRNSPSKRRGGTSLRKSFLRAIPTGDLQIQFSRVRCSSTANTVKMSRLG